MVARQVNGGWRMDDAHYSKRDSYSSTKRVD
jgi:hypothetical protein